LNARSSTSFRAGHVLLGKTLHLWQSADLPFNLLRQASGRIPSVPERWHHAVPCRTSAGSKAWVRSADFVPRGNFLRRLHASCALTVIFSKSQHNQPRFF